MTGETMLRVGNVRSEGDLEIVRDALDDIGAGYEHLRSEPEDSYPQTAYFYVSSDLSEEPTTCSTGSPRSTASTPRSSERLRAGFVPA